jgi:2'-5' RNA ligase
MRLFVGMPLAPVMIDELSAIALRLRSKVDGLRWLPPESWHITLQFLGNTSQEQYESISAKLRALKMPPVRIKLEGLSVFDRVGVLFTGVALTPVLRMLHDRVVTTTADCGFVAETRPYLPHISLARFKANRSRQELLALKAQLRHQPEFAPVFAREVLIYESFLGITGSRYEICERFPLA